MVKGSGGVGFPGEEGYEEGSYTPDAENRVSGSFVNDPTLAALLARPAAVAWIPNPGDAFAGTVLDIRTAESEYGEYPLLDIDCGNMVLAFHAYHTTVQKDIERRNIRPGDKLAVAYLGEKESKTKGHSAFHQYRVIHEPKTSGQESLF